jgi:hypothetical protein
MKRKFSTRFETACGIEVMKKSRAGAQQKTISAFGGGAREDEAAAFIREDPIRDSALHARSATNFDLDRHRARTVTASREDWNKLGESNIVLGAIGFRPRETRLQ